MTVHHSFLSKRLYLDQNNFVLIKLKRLRSTIKTKTFHYQTKKQNYKEKEANKIRILAEIYLDVLRDSVS